MGNAKNIEQFRIPFVLFNVVDQRPRSIGCIGRMYLAARETPDKEGIDRAGQQLALLRPFSRPFDIVEQPGDLSTRKIRIEQQAGPAREFWLHPSLPELMAKR